MMNQSHTPQALWKNYGKPLVFMLPGATGTKDHENPGYRAMAATFWLNGLSAYAFSGPGQDFGDGEYSLENCLNAARRCLETVCEECNPPVIVVFGSCAGGIIAAHLAAERPKEGTILVLWETPLNCTSAEIEEITERLRGKAGMRVSSQLGVIYQLRDTLDKISCPVLFAFGEERPPGAGVFRHAEIDSIVQGVSSPRCCVETRCFPGATHDAPRGDNPEVLRGLLSCILEFLQRHGDVAAGFPSRIPNK